MNIIYLKRQNFKFLYDMKLIYNEYNNVLISRGLSRVLKAEVGKKFKMSFTANNIYTNTLSLSNVIITYTDKFRVNFLKLGDYKATTNPCEKMIAKYITDLWCNSASKLDCQGNQFQNLIF